MVLILDMDPDRTCCDVIEWLQHYGSEVYRVNTKNDIENIEMNISSNNISIQFKEKDETLYLEKIKSYWYRSGNFPMVLFEETGVKDFNEYLKWHISEEKKVVIEYLHLKLNRIKHINNVFTYNINKLIVLETAKKVGLKIPETIVTSLKKSVESFKTKNGSIITKTLGFPLFSKADNQLLTGYTQLVNDQDIENKADYFSVSKFQNLIEKKYEIRTFFLENEFHSMVIFSQKDDATILDFRNYNEENPNRRVPYQLPKSIEKKLKKLMNELDINCGSIDIIYTTKNEYLFLEINPIGQFGLVSNPCNYYLEEKVALMLHNNN